MSVAFHRFPAVLHGWARARRNKLLSLKNPWHTYVYPIHTYYQFGAYQAQHKCKLHFLVYKWVVLYPNKSAYPCANREYQPPPLKNYPWCYLIYPANKWGRWNSFSEILLGNMNFLTDPCSELETNNKHWNQ